MFPCAEKKRKMYKYIWPNYDVTNIICGITLVSFTLILECLFVLYGTEKLRHFQVIIICFYKLIDVIFNPTSKMKCICFILFISVDQS